MVAPGPMVKYIARKQEPFACGTLVTTDAIAGNALKKGPDRDTSHKSASRSLAFAK